MKKIFLIFLFTSITFAQHPLLTLFDGVSQNSETIEYKRLIDSVGGSITAPDLAAINVFITEIATIRSKIIRFNPFAGANLITACVPLFRGESLGKVYGNAIDVNSGSTVFQSADYTRTGGLGSNPNFSKYLNTGVILSAIGVSSQNSLTLGSFSLSDAVGNYIDIGGSDGTRYSFSYTRYSPGILRYSMNSGVVPTGGVANASTIAMILASRTDATTQKYYINADSVYTHSVNSNGEPTTEIYAMALNNNGTAYGFSNRKLSGYIIAAGLTTAEVVILYNAWNKLKIAFGR